MTIRSATHGGNFKGGVCVYVQAPDQCLSRSAHLEMYCLDEGTLRLVRMTWNDILLLEDSQDVGTDTESFGLLPTANLQSGSMGVWEEGTGGQYEAAAFFASEPNSLTLLRTTQVTKKLHLWCQTEIFNCFVYL